MPIAMNIDYGVLSRINVPLEQPSDLEVVLMSTAVPHGDLSQLPAGASVLVDQPR